MRWSWPFIFLLILSIQLSFWINFTWIDLIAWLLPGVTGVSVLYFLWKLFYTNKIHTWSLAIGLIGYQSILNTFPPPSFFAKTSASNSIQILSMNVRVFNRYEKSNKDHHESNQLLQWILKQDADIICLQEFVNNKTSTHLNYIDKIKHTYPFYAYASTNPDFAGTTYGSVIFSKTPILYTDNLPSSSTTNKSVFADVKYQNDTVRVYSIHQASFRLSSVERKKKNTTPWLKLKSTLKAHSHETNFLLTHCAASPFKNIITGDFNATPYSTSYYKITKHFKDAYTEDPMGYGGTFHAPYWPPLRIDYQFISKNLKCIKFDRINDMPLSDHYPLMARYTLK